jgi:hypothetical protein
MTDIYRQAANVVVWPGESTPTSTAAFELIHGIDLRVGDDYDYLHKHCLFNPKHELLPKSVTEALLVHLRKDSSKAGLDGLGVDLANRTYWTRMWTIQETGVASGILITCGNDSMRWLHFYQAFFAIRSLSNEVRHTSIRNLHALGLAKHIDIWRNTSDYKDMGLVDLVVNVRTMSATNPKDKIYVLLGMIDDRWSYKPKFSVLIPDYSETTTVLDVYRDPVQYSLARDKSLDIICLQHRYENMKGSWPSWVSDWTFPIPPMDNGQDNAVIQRVNMVKGSNLISPPLIARFISLA